MARDTVNNSGLLLFICAGILLSIGGLLCGTSFWSVVRMSYYLWTTELCAELCGGAVLAAGALLSLPAAWLATRPRATLALLIVTSASMVTLSSGVSSSAALARALRDSAAINASMQRALAYAGSELSVRNAFYSMQIDLKCCGVQGPADWYQYRNTLPPSCCGKAWTDKRGSPCGAGYPSGCLRRALADITDYNNTVTLLAGVLIVALAVTLFTAVSSLVWYEEARKPPASVTRLPPPCVACFHSPPLSTSRCTLLPPALYPASVTQV